MDSDEAFEEDHNNATGGGAAPEGQSLSLKLAQPIIAEQTWIRQVGPIPLSTSLTFVGTGPTHIILRLSAGPLAFFADVELAGDGTAKFLFSPFGLIHLSVEESRQTASGVRASVTIELESGFLPRVLLGKGFIDGADHAASAPLSASPKTTTDYLALLQLLSCSSSGADGGQNRVASPVNDDDVSGGGTPAAPIKRVVAEMFLNADAENALSFAGFRAGLTAQAASDALIYLESRDDVNEADFELRFLEIPSISYYALWLHNAQREILHPVFPTSASLQSVDHADTNAVLEGLAAAAANILDQELRHAGPSGG